MLLAQAGRVEVGLEVLDQLVVHRYAVLLAALLVQAEHAAVALLVVVADLAAEGGADASGGEQERAEQRRGAQAAEIVDRKPIEPPALPRRGGDRRGAAPAREGRAVALDGGAPLGRPAGDQEG